MEAKNAPATLEKVRESLLKLNDTPFYLNELKGNIDEGVFVPAKTVNELRRTLCDKLINKEEKQVNKISVKNKKRERKHSPPIIAVSDGISNASGRVIPFLMKS